jgi:DNA-binding CsgD family transcriptional regulator
MSEMISDDEKAGVPLPPPVELTPRSPPLTITEAGPLPPEPPPPPFDRVAILAGVQAGFASLTDDELRVAQLWLIGESFDDVCDAIQMEEKTVRKLWQDMRRKLRAGLKPND